MLNAIKLMQNHFDPEAIENILGIPCYIYVKDLNGRYKYVNHFKAINCGFEKSDDLLGMNDYDIFPEATALQLRKNDSNVLTQNNTLTYFEQAILSARKERIFGLSCKTPTFSNSNEIIGVAGVTIVLKTESLNEDHIASNDSPIEDSLTKRQKECLYFLVKGMSQKQIAFKLGVSPRTVEHHIESIKYKLHCHSHSDLIAEALQFSFIKVQLLFS